MYWSMESLNGYDDEVIATNLYVEYTHHSFNREIYYFVSRQFPYISVWTLNVDIHLNLHC